jgi:hypothetical protein
MGPPAIAVRWASSFAADAAQFDRLAAAWYNVAVFNIKPRNFGIGRSKKD